jgi:hypothetical protein
MAHDRIEPEQIPTRTNRVAIARWQFVQPFWLNTPFTHLTVVKLSHVGGKDNSGRSKMIARHHSSDLKISAHA